jgi:hypothetical protein
MPAGAATAATPAVTIMQARRTSPSGSTARALRQALAGASTRALPSREHDGKLWLATMRAIARAHRRRPPTALACKGGPVPWEAVRGSAIVVESPGVAQSRGSGGWGRSKLPRIRSFLLTAVSF